MKKILMLILAAMVASLMIGCGGGDGASNNEVANSAKELQDKAKGSPNYPPDTDMQDMNKKGGK